ncbi:MAG: M20/M25/M40 family metallo-hydrolase [Calditrichia bacterium]
MKKFTFLGCIFILLTFVGSPARSQISGCDFDADIELLMSRISADSIAMHVQNLANAGGNKSRISYTPGNEWAAAYIKQVFDRYPGLTEVHFDTFYAPNAIPPYHQTPMVNVVATLRGNSLPNRYYLVGGHFDATANLDPNLSWPSDWATAHAAGADDNASGVAAILEIARVLSDPGNRFAFLYNIKFVAFGAEERHPIYNNDNHLGSGHYASSASQNGDQILGAYIVDMIGFNATGRQHFNIVSNDVSQVLGERMLAVNDAYQIGLHSNSAPFVYATYSDHERFWAYDYKSILLIEHAPPWENFPPWYTANPFYHRESDISGTVNIPQVEKIAKLTLGTITCMSGGIVGIAEAVPAGLAEEFRLAQNYPNPFNGGTEIRYQIFSGGAVKLRIFDIAGQIVATLVDRNLAPGDYRLNWDGLSDRGEQLPSGLYFLALTMNGQLNVRKLTLLK